MGEEVILFLSLLFLPITIVACIGIAGYILIWELGENMKKNKAKGVSVWKRWYFIL